MMLIFSTLILLISGCTFEKTERSEKSGKLKESYKELDSEHRRLADICIDRANAHHNQILITTADNLVTKTKRILLNYTIANFIRCDFKEDNNLITAEEINDGAVIKSF